ncbi:MAG: response regulator transcription factor, partial [Anaerolinea sp.]|nr:response regulator transcription factor [Anaerolinea sp.]
MSYRILIVDDDKELTKLLQSDLREAGYDALIAFDGLEGLRQFHSARPDLVILDVAMPHMDGRIVCQRIREVSDVPILMMSAHAISEEDIVNGLNIGADEFMIKPLRSAEFRARINALLRRARLAEQDSSLPTSYQDNYLSVDIPLRRVSVNGRDVRLTPTEFKLLALFVQHPDEVLTFQQLLEDVWGFEYNRENHYPRIY